MPIYDFKCGAGHRFERIVPLAEFDARQDCDCGAVASRLVSAPMVISDCIDPTYGMDGKLYDSRKAFENSTNDKGDKFIPLGDGVPESTNIHEYAPTEASIRDAIRGGMEDVKNGRVPAPVILED